MDYVRILPKYKHYKKRVYNNIINFIQDDTFFVFLTLLNFLFKRSILSLLTRVLRELEF